MNREGQIQTFKSRPTVNYFFTIMSGIERAIVKQTKTVNLWRVLYIISLLYLNKNVIFVYAYILLRAL